VAPAIRSSETAAEALDVKTVATPGPATLSLSAAIFMIATLVGGATASFGAEGGGELHQPFLLAQLADDGSTAAQARAVEDPWAGVEEMVVTGSDFAGALLDSPASVTSFDAIELEAQAVQNVGDLSAITPNLEIRRNSATQATFFIRGVGLSDFGANATSAVAVAQDGINLNTAPLQLGQIFDASAVDVLRGPRGIGPYRNASAGAIAIQSRKPEFEVGASLRARIGSWAPDEKGAHHGLIQDYEGFLNVPLVEDVLSSRVSFRIRKADPYKVNGCGFALPVDQRVPRRSTNQDPGPASQCGEKEPLTFPGFVPGRLDGLSPIPEGLPEKYGEEDNWAARGLLLFRPSNSDAEWVLNIHGGRLDQQPTVGQAAGTGFYAGSSIPKPLGGIVNGFGATSVNYQEPDQRADFVRRCGTRSPAGGCETPDAAANLARSLARNLDKRPYRGDYNREGRSRLENWGVTLSGTIPILDRGWSTLELSSRSSYDSYERYENRDLDFTPETIFESKDEDEAFQVWQDMALEGEIQALPIAWDAGFYFFYEELDANLFLFLPLSPLSPNTVEFTGIRRKYDQETWAFGTWAGLKWDLSERLRLSGGARFNWENKTFDFDRTQAGTTQSISEDEVWDEWTGTAALEYSFTEDISATIKYTRGFKPGTFNAGVSAQSQTSPVEPESIDAFEGIFALGVWNGRIQLQAELFYYLYENYQIFLFADAPVGPPVLEIRNASEVENYGLDAEINLLPLEGLVDERVEGLKLNVRFGWLESQFIDFTNRRLFSNAIGQTVPVTVDYSGNRLPNSPRFSLSGSVEWELQVGRLGSIIPRYDMSYTDDVYYDADEGRGGVNSRGENLLPDFTTGQRGYWLHNVRMTYRPLNSNLEIAGWVRNLTDQRYKNFSFDASQFSNLVITLVGDPRTFGVDMRITF
jgi:iron complex outermembrane receptor protein